MNKVVPNLIIAGVNKSGTTSLFTYLSYHPDICASNIKETCFFLTHRYDEQSEPIEKYHKYFSHFKGESITMESTPGYFYGGKKLAEKINSTCPDVRIYLMFREPVSRLISFYNKKKSRMDLPTEMTLRDYVDTCKSMSVEERNKRENNLFFGIDGGFYSDHIQEWFDVFGDRLKVLFLDDLIKNPRQMLKEIALENSIDETFFDSVDLEVENQSVGYKLGFFHLAAIRFNHFFEKVWRLNPGLKKFLRSIYVAINGSKIKPDNDAQVKAELKELYQPYNNRFRELLSKNGVDSFPAWLEEEKVNA